MVGGMGWRREVMAYTELGGGVQCKQGMNNVRWRDMSGHGIDRCGMTNERPTIRLVLSENIPSKLKAMAVKFN
ncbi:uncharacterized protein G2W53_011770 [Senna tora]|uniref:Uncharacterized protein n=1 Tax=Senna tora TaxID=362788 RepID=A0A835CCS2_9FABA|nr:uncharacterized protein G2W53_011770 [Senna tora]